jgi:hypothetical protein
MCEYSLDEKLESTIRSKLERYAFEYSSLPEKSIGRQSVDSRAFEYINNLPKPHLRQGYIRYYYECRHKEEKR